MRGSLSAVRPTICSSGGRDLQAEPEHPAERSGAQCCNNPPPSKTTIHTCIVSQVLENVHKHLNLNKGYQNVELYAAVKYVIHIGNQKPYLLSQRFFFFFQA